MVTRSKMPGVTVTPGNQLVAVPVSVRNTGDEAWTSHSDMHAEVTDTSGATYSSDPAYTERARRQGAAGHDQAGLGGADASGLVVFEVPRGTQVAKFRLMVGPGLPTTLRWSVN